MNGLATASFFAFGALLVLFGANASEIIRDLSLDYAEFGFLASMLSMGIGSGILCAGPAADRLPRRPLFVLSVGGVAFTSFAVGTSIDYSSFLVASFGIGFGAGFYETVLNTVIVEQSGLAAPRRLLFIHSAATLGATLTPFAIGLLREPLALEWLDSFRMAGVLHGALLLGTGLLPASRASTIAPKTPSPVAANGHRRLLAAICLATFVYVGVESALTFFVADYAQNDLGLAAGRASGSIGFFWLGLLVGRMAIGLSPRAPSAGTTSLLALVSATVVCAFFSFGVPSVEWAMTITGFFLGGVFPIMIGMAGIARPQATGMAVALAAGLGSLGGFVIPWLTGIIATATDLGTALASLSIWLFLLVLTSAAIHRRQAR
jgi:fucose permease